MTRARSRADQTDAQIAAMELARGRTKESLAWDLVNTHDVELKHVNRRVEGLEATTQTIVGTLSEIRNRQQLAAQTETQILEKLETIVATTEKTNEKARADSKWSATRKSELFRNLIAFCMMLLAIVATTLDRCNR